VQLLARAHRQVKRQRSDFHHSDCQHQGAPHLVQTNDTIACEDVQTANMVQHHHLATSIQEAGRGQFVSILAAKAV
jgi:transposase